MSRKKSNRRLKREAEARMMVALSLPNSEQDKHADTISNMTMTKEQVQRLAKGSRSERDRASLTAPRQWVNHCAGGLVDSQYSELKLGYRRSSAFDGHRLTCDNKTKLDQRARNRRKVTLGKPQPSSKLTLQEFNLIFGANAS